MGRIVEAKDKVSLKQEWETIFSSSDPFGLPFTKKITAFLVFYPTEGYYLEEVQYIAITEAAKLLGDEDFWVSETEWQVGGFSTGNHWLCAFPAYQDYIKLSLPLENAIYSPRSQWGALLSHEDHAIVGGTPQFIEQVKLLYPNWALDVDRLRQAWAGHPEGSWVDALLSQIHT